MRIIKNKRGIEPVIATVLLIVITIAVIGVVVAFLMPYIQGIMDKQTACKDVKLDIDSSGSCSNATDTQIMVSVGLGDFNISKILLQVTSGGKTTTYPITADIPGQGGARTYNTTTVNGLQVSATRVGAVPYVLYNKKEYACDGSKVELTPVPACA